MKNVICSVALVAALALPTVALAHDPQSYPGHGANFNIRTDCTYSYYGIPYMFTPVLLNVGATFKDTAAEYAQSVGEYYEDNYPHLNMDCVVIRTNPGGKEKVLWD